MDPFGGIVVNFNAITRMHIDGKDDKICLVLVISDCEGGDLCFYELGIRIKMESGDFIIFCSRDLTHFNLDYKGWRTSMVFHSDGSGKAWIQSRNGYQDMPFFSSSQL